jgi:capsular polysaccharide biosynthesis protein
MQHPYGYGLLVPPDGLRPKIVWFVSRILRSVSIRLLRPLDLFGLRVKRIIWAKERIGGEIRNYRVMHPRQTVDLTVAGDAKFLKVASNYASGELVLGEVFVSEVSPAFYYPALGLVANRRFEVFGDSILLPHRFHLSAAYRSVRPLRWSRRAGPISSIQRIDAYNFWHWMADCLPQLLMLEKYMQGEPLTLLAGDNLGGFQRETLALMLSPTMHVEFVPAETWIRTDRFILPSYLSGRCNGYLPENYYAEIRRRITQGLGLPESIAPDLRIYLSRAGARRRRVTNETAVMELLRHYGFICVRPETMSMREQVGMFQRASVIVGPHGAALGGMVFSTEAKVLVLYPERHPGEYFYTMARRIGLEHHAVIHDYGGDEDSVEDFAVDLVRLRKTLEDGMGLRFDDHDATQHV